MLPLSTRQEVFKVILIKDWNRSGLIPGHSAKRCQHPIVAVAGVSLLPARQKEGPRVLPNHGLKGSSASKRSAREKAQRAHVNSASTLIERDTQDRARALSPKPFLFTNVKAGNFGESSPLDQCRWCSRDGSNCLSIYVLHIWGIRRQKYST